MYNITELNEMPDADLKSVAEGMGIKKIDLSKREELVYRILDQQAIDRAAATTAERKRRAEATFARDFSSRGFYRYIAIGSCLRFFLHCCGGCCFGRCCRRLFGALFGWAATALAFYHSGGVFSRLA